MKETYNKLAKRQREFYQKIEFNFKEFDETPKDELQKQTFYQSNFGLTTEEFRELQRVKVDIDKVLEQLKAEGVYPTADELINGFEVI
jgi:hypothetical protein